MERAWHRLDLGLIAAALGLSMLGVLLVYSASRGFGNQSLLDTAYVRQMIYLVMGLALMALVSTVDYRLLGSAAPAFYALAILMLGVVLVVGEDVYGARRSFNLPFMPIRPSELAKLLMVIVVAKYLADREGTASRWRTLIVSLALMALPAALVYLQPDLGTALVFGAVWLAMVLMVGARLLHVALVAAGAVAATPLVFPLLLHDYMRERVATFLDPAVDPLGKGYNVLQSEISVGSGGFFGKGLANGSQTQLHFLRVQNTDFIFSVLGEELGFVGALLLFALFTYLLFRGVRVAALSHDTFGRLLATGIVTMILVQVFINVGGNIRLLPVTGIPLPLISYGGSSMITVMLALGVLQSVLVGHRKLRFRA